MLRHIEKDSDVLCTYLTGCDEVALIGRPVKVQHPATVPLEQLARLDAHHRAD